ncbi:MAG: alpha-ketoacid dehydrogenase subunit beta [Actinobacteria bacterium]|nr:alpha-ketoacid dehydrogenase subunit beta [Actinomycetota bacterium]
MREITYRESINEAYREEMRKDKNIIVFGEDIAEHGGAFGVTKGLLDEFGPDRVRNTPISETAIAGAAIGCSIVGLRPIAEFMFDDFLPVAGDQIINQMAKLRYMSGGQLKLPLTVRMPMGGGLSQAAQHAQCLIGIFMNVPGLKIVCPSTPYDAKGIFKSAIKDDNPVLVFEHLKLYENKGEVPQEQYYIPIGKADIKREGKDVTIIAISEMVVKSLNVAKKMEEKGVSIEVIDPISLVPLDMETIINSIKKTEKAVVAYNGSRSSGAGAEIVARINEFAFEYLDSPIYRVAEKDCPIPFSPVLEREVLPQEEDLISAIEEILSH